MESGRMQGRKRVLARNPVSWHLSVRHQASRTVRKKFLWYFADFVAARADRHYPHHPDTASRGEENSHKRDDGYVRIRALRKSRGALGM